MTDWFEQHLGDDPSIFGPYEDEPPVDNDEPDENEEDLLEDYKDCE